MVEISGFIGNGEHTAAAGKRVTRTGLALVHENERVVPEAGSEAEAILALETGGREVHLHFPVEIEIRGSGGPEVDLTAEIERVLLGVAQRLAGAG